MINSNVIVPVKKTDLLSLYSVILAVANVNPTSVAASALGEFDIQSGTGNLIASEPVKTFNFGSSVTSFTLYFVADYDYKGFISNGAAATIADNGVVIDKDGATLYKAVLSGGTVTITKVGY